MATNPEPTYSNTASTAIETARVPRLNWGWFLLRGILAIILGVIALLFPLSALFAFTLVFAAFAFADGVASIVSGIRGARHRQERWGALIFAGVVGVLVGVLFVAMPGLSTLTYAFVTLSLIACWSLLTGIMELVAAIRLRKAIESEWLLALAGIFSILLGIFIVYVMLTDPLSSILSVAWLIGLYALAAGIVLVVQALRLRMAGSTSQSAPS